MVQVVLLQHTESNVSAQPPGQGEQDEMLLRVRSVLARQQPEPSPPTAANARALYRVLRDQIPSPTDFRSNLSKCWAPRGPELADPIIWAGLSMWDTRDLAERAARRYKGRIGAYVGAVHVAQDDARVLIRPTLSPGHVTVMACEESLTLLVCNGPPAKAGGFCR